jgi:hypothetical protein
VTGAHEPAHHVGPHPAETDHSELHIPAPFARRPRQASDRSCPLDCA